jgi:hypothetical protein
MKRLLPRFFILLCITVLLSTVTIHAQSPTGFRRLPIETYRQKMIAGWLGQMTGVSLGAPTEFRYLGEIIPEDEVPQPRPGLMNDAFNQDDLYVEMTFLKSLDDYGLDVSAAQAGIDFTNSEYQLWFANLAARSNLRLGIAPPDSGHPAFSRYSDDIDFQIESDFAGLISPGLPNSAIALGEKFGSIMNYGDGLYAGQFMACMYSEAFFERDPRALVEYGLSCIPAESQYAEAIRDVLRWSQEHPDDWTQTWALVNEKYHLNPDYRRYSSNEAAGMPPEFNIDAKINGAYVVMGLLYGQGDPMRTITVAMRSGQDSDCNPASASGILATALGYDALPDLFKDGLNETEVFSYTAYDFNDLIAVSERLAREAVLAAGGTIETDASGAEVFVIPVQVPQPSPFVQSWEPGEIAGSFYSDAEMAQIHFEAPRSLARDVERFAPGWTAVDCPDSDFLGLKDEIFGRSNILFTQPQSQAIPCRLLTSLTLPEDAPALHLVVGHFPLGDWILVARVNGDVLAEQVVGDDTAPGGWLELELDLAAYAGQPVLLELLNQANGRDWEGGYWAEIAVVEQSSP